MQEEICIAKDVEWKEVKSRGRVCPTKIMAQATFSVRMDETLKKQFDTLCSDFGMTASTAINVFARAVVRERKIPFEIVSPEPEITREKAMQAFWALRTQAEKNFPQGMSLEEINEEIRKARSGEEDLE